MASGKGPQGKKGGLKEGQRVKLGILGRLEGALLGLTEKVHKSKRRVLRRN